LGGEELSPEEWRELCAGAEGLRFVKGRWVEVDQARMREVLDHWERVQESAADGVSFLEGMRLLSELSDALEVEEDAPGAAPAGEAAAWSEVHAGAWLEEMLEELRSPARAGEADPGAELHATLRPYQREGVAWLWLLWRLGLGACLADDMGLGKTIQVLAMLLLMKQ